jgi:hypothetical protein
MRPCCLLDNSKVTLLMEAQRRQNGQWPDCSQSASIALNARNRLTAV